MPSDTPTSRADEAARVDSIKRDHERKHFIFAMVLVMGCVFGLPILGTLYVLAIRWGWLAYPS